MIFGDLGINAWAAFLLVLVRCSAMVAVLPFFGSPNIPNLAKAGFSLSLALVISPVVELDPALVPRDLPAIAILAVSEVLIGAILGFAVRMLLTSVQIMGQLIGFQMGFAVANVLDPVGGGQVSVLAQFTYLMTILVFFAVGAHHWFFKALADSFVLVPPGSFGMSRGLFDQIIGQAGDMFTLALRLGAPVIGALLFTQVVMGILAKTVPQMNILIVGFPITISVGLIFLATALTLIVPIMGDKFKTLGPVFTGLLKAM